MFRRPTRRTAAATSMVASLMALAPSQPAGAATLSRSDSFTFTAASTGSPVTCTILSTQELPVGDDPQLASGETQVVSGPPPCSDYFDVAEVRATYREPGGGVVSEPASVGNGGFVKAYFRPVASELVTFHRVRFEDCVSSCATPEYRLPSTK
jgi:hypothetical protein